VVFHRDEAVGLTSLAYIVLKFAVPKLDPALQLAAWLQDGNATFGLNNFALGLQGMMEEEWARRVQFLVVQKVRFLYPL
jgi:hypothetical protein